MATIIDIFISIKLFLFLQQESGEPKLALLKKHPDVTRA